MLFNSNEFLSFFVIFYAGFFLTRGKVPLRNLLLIVASYVFYGAWDYRFTGLLLGTSVMDWALALVIDNSRSQARRRALVVASLTVNIGVLVVFKYFNFFRDSFEALLATFGMGSGSFWKGWNVVLPVGISFYTFQSMGYVIDVYRRVTPACRNFLQYQAFISFFPQLVAGPIERANHMLPQFARPLPIVREDLERGIWLIIWGMFKKVVLADNLSPMVELAYQHSAPSFWVVLLGTAAFGLQVYYDFSGYSDIARGLGRLMGFDLMLNFNRPYFATSVREFWRRWHISLSTWLRDYLYFPLGGSRKGEARTALNLVLTMLICGLWHGAALTFLLWGLWHGLGLLANRLWHRFSPLALPAPIAWMLTTLFVLYGWMLFRAQSFDQILQMNRALADFSAPNWFRPFLVNLLVLAIPLVVEGMFHWEKRQGLFWRWDPWPRSILQGAMVLAIIAFWQVEAPRFIYFQF